VKKTDQYQEFYSPLVYVEVASPPIHCLHATNHFVEPTPHLTTNVFKLSQKMINEAPFAPFNQEWLEKTASIIGMMLVSR